MPKSERLRKSKEFRRIFQRGKSFVGEKIVVYVLENELPCSRVGVATSRKLGGAVERNRLKRIAKEALRTCGAELREGIDLVLVPRARAKTASFQEVRDELGRLLARSGALEEAFEDGGGRVGLREEGQGRVEE